MFSLINVSVISTPPHSASYSVHTGSLTVGEIDVKQGEHTFVIDHYASCHITVCVYLVIENPEAISP